ncbi:unnamed protein product [Allacma fusca]|uniref:Uncharacterized protein n=1 Tax=Allacma fusca TaxID=39272 RepID=A0A8J2P8N4_9HEXA|nr:unnamed protein product [Allacma fusca]
MSEFSQGEKVWFEPSGLGYSVPGVVTEFHRQGGVVIIETAQDQENGDIKESQNSTPQNNTFTVEVGGSNALKRRYFDNPVDDMVQLSDLSEEAILWNVKKRYEAGSIYTYIGSILLAVNPYKMFDIYGLPYVKRYEGKFVNSTLPPHLFAIGSSAYTRMVKDKKPQVVVISGESGSGKTEAAKLVVGYLALVNKSNSNLITEQILEAGPLLESFGNAKTIKNDNSSRFGKYVHVYFHEGKIIGAKINEYLLEKSRIVTQNVGERNYHVFYEMLRGLGKDLREKYGLGSADKYFYLNQGGATSISGKEDFRDFSSLLGSMEILGLSSDEIDSVLRILAAVLHLGNIYFHRKTMKHGVEGVEIGSDAEIQWTGHLLHLNPDGIRRALMFKTTEARGERVVTPLSIDQSLDNRDAIAKVLYSNLFTWLVARVNRIVFNQRDTPERICILDIFGFEDFQENNSFEQLCINYANETLQHHLNRHIFKLEQMDYSKEKIEWEFIMYDDNSCVLSLMGKKPVGILHLLDDESNFPKGTDVSFLEKSHYNHALNEYYLRPRIGCNEFGVKHYAGPVFYNVEGFLEKNRDTLRADVMQLLSSSTSQIISRMFKSNTSTRNVNLKNRFITMKPRAPTVAARFSDSLNNLLESMGKCYPWFVRCIKPNQMKMAEVFDVPLVQQQLKYTGVLETIRIRKHGYPYRLTYRQFATTYKCLIQGNYHTNDTDVTREILSHFSNKNFQFGSHKIFIRTSLEEELEIKRNQVHNDSAMKIQANVRGFLTRKLYKRNIKAAIIIQSFIRMLITRSEYLSLKRASTTLQKHWRGVKGRRRAKAIKEEKTRMLENRNRILTSGAVGHLEIPAQLAFSLHRLADAPKQPKENNVIKVSPSNISAFVRKKQLPKKLEVNEPRLLTSLGHRREPITAPFLKDSPVEESLSTFKLILRYMNESNTNEDRDLLIQSYIIKRCLQNPGLRDEILIQLVNQTHTQDKQQKEKVLHLLGNCLSSFPPSEEIYSHLYRFATTLDHPFANQVVSKLKDCQLNSTRLNSPCYLESKCLKLKCDSSFSINLPQLGDATVGGIGSWEVYSNVGGWVWDAYNDLNSSATLGSAVGLGWGIDVVWDGRVEETYSSGYIHDYFSYLEDEDSKNPVFQSYKYLNRPQVPPPQPPEPLQQLAKRRTDMKTTRSLENLLSMKTYLSSSKLNERYNNLSIDNLVFDDYEIRPEMKESPGNEIMSSFPPSEAGPSNQRQVEDFYEVEKIKSRRAGPPRFIKASSAASKKSSIAGSYSSRHYIEKASDGVIRSSALSDTSEAPSLASHVRRVRVPSQASDVDQFLDDLFSPVLDDGGMDDMSDVRSIVHSIK